MECWCDEPLWDSQLKSSSKVITLDIDNEELLKDVLACFSKRNNAIMLKLCFCLLIYHSI